MSSIQIDTKSYVRLLCTLELGASTLMSLVGVGNSHEYKCLLSLIALFNRILKAEEGL